MSFYLGKDNVGDKILHMSTGHATEGAMKSGKVAGTIFHSKHLELPVYTLAEFTYSSQYGPANTPFATPLGLAASVAGEAEYSRVEVYFTPTSLAGETTASFLQRISNIKIGTTRGVILFLDSNYSTITEINLANFMFDCSSGGSRFTLAYIESGFTGVRLALAEHSGNRDVNRAATQFKRLKYICVLEGNKAISIAQGPILLDNSDLKINNVSIFRTYNFYAYNATAGTTGVRKFLPFLVSTIPSQITSVAISANTTSAPEIKLNGVSFLYDNPYNKMLAMQTSIYSRYGVKISTNNTMPGTTNVRVLLIPASVIATFPAYFIVEFRATLDCLQISRACFVVEKETMLSKAHHGLLYDFASGDYNDGEGREFYSTEVQLYFQGNNLYYYQYDNRYYSTPPRYYTDYMDVIVY